MQEVHERIKMFRFSPCRNRKIPVHTFLHKKGVRKIKKMRCRDSNLVEEKGHSQRIHTGRDFRDAGGIRSRRNSSGCNHRTENHTLIEGWMAYRPNGEKEIIMNGYEFTRFESDYRSKVKAQAYDANYIRHRLLDTFAKQNINYKDLPDYKDSEFWFFETTSSCTEKEAIDWMRYYMTNAIAYGIATKNLDWRTKFLAGYDLFIELTGGKYAMSNREAKFNQVC